MYKLRPQHSYLSFGAFGCYAINLLFFIICFCTNHWWYFRLDGKDINMGLWIGCWQSVDGGSECSNSVFENKIFKEGGGSDWYHGARILMTCSLIAIFLQEFALIGYLCINEVEKYRQKLAGAILGFSAVVVFLLLLNFIIIGAEVGDLPQGRIGWSFGLTFLCIPLEGAIGVAIFLERRNEQKIIEKLKPDVTIEVNSNIRHSGLSVVKDLPDPYPRDDLSYSYRSSTGSLSLHTGSYYHIPGNLSIDSVSTDVVNYSEEPGSSKRGQKEWEV
ncbi:uncharacterized protein LOC134255210 [Saccostrea cucullata]|uniref:uncharacterized protein LOC134255210 n=1 Tax=Saccostrea cuccullata TaxID=36930 RepID=UPI002ED4EC92